MSKKYFFVALFTVSVILTACGQSSSSIDATVEDTTEVSTLTEETAVSTEEDSTTLSEALASTEVSENEAVGEESGFTVTVSDDQIMYATEIADIRDLPNEEGEQVGQLEQDEEVTVTGYVESYKGEPCLWYQIGYNQFVNAAYLNDKPVAVQQTATKKKSTTSSTKKNTQQQSDAAAKAAAAQKAAQAAAAQQAAQQAAAAAAAQQAAQQEYYEYYEYEDGGMITESWENADNLKNISSGGHPGEVY